MPGGSTRASLAAAAALWFGGAPGVVLAGAWTLEDGAGQVIARATVSTASDTFGDTADSNSRYSKAESQFRSNYRKERNQALSWNGGPTDG